MSEESPYQIVEPQCSPVPIVISIPHCGFKFPEDIQNQYHPELIEAPDDTDWFVDRLYDFAPEMGITMITSKYSRWVIDLNRDPLSQPLYDDGRIITALVPETDFTGTPLYHQASPDQAEIDRRLELYYQPYHLKLNQLLQMLKKDHPRVLLWEAHSIRQLVPTIHKTSFPDLILGDADGQSCNQDLIDTTLNSLGEGPYQLSHNSPFKGGHITRQYGKPETGINGLQLEMTKINYMDDGELNYHESRASNVQALLTKTFKQLIEVLV